MATTKSSTKKKSDPKMIEERWGKPLTQSGWTAFPSVLVRRQKGLGLSALDINILLHLMTYWWYAGNDPHPSKKTIADAIDVTPRTVQKRIAAMEAAGLITRKKRYLPAGGSTTNQYSFEGLIKELEPFAQEELDRRAARQAEDREQAKRKKPRNFMNTQVMKRVK